MASSAKGAPGKNTLKVVAGMDRYDPNKSGEAEPQRATARRAHAKTAIDRDPTSAVTLRTKALAEAAPEGGAASPLPHFMSATITGPQAVRRMLPSA